MNHSHQVETLHCIQLGQQTLPCFIASSTSKHKAIVDTKQMRKRGLVMNEKTSCITINCAGCGGNIQEEVSSLFKKVYKLEVNATKDYKIAIPYPDELCNSENFIPISLAVKSMDGFLNEKTPIIVSRITDGTIMVEKLKN